MTRYGFAAFSAIVFACNPSLSVEETEQALEESAVSSQAETATASAAELVLATGFTASDAVSAAAQKIKDFVASQLACAAITVTDATVAIEYGAKPGDCTYNGQTYSGQHVVTVTRNTASEVLVHHQWDEFSNGIVSVSGTADVTWNVKTKSRRIKHDLSWEREKDGLTGDGSGDRTQTPLSGGIQEGVKVSGERSWQGEKGEWKLEIDGVEIRWADPVPQAGTWKLDTPFDGKSLTLSFHRKSDTEIEVSAKTGRRTFKFIVRRSGLIVRSD